LAYAVRLFFRYKRKTILTDNFLYRNSRPYYRYVLGASDEADYFGVLVAGIAKDRLYIPIDKPPHYVEQYGRILAAGKGNVGDFTRTGKEGFYRPYCVVYLLA
jgi:hypothetical protein